MIRCELRVAGWSGLRAPLLGDLVLAIGDAGFDLRPLFVIVPGGDQQEWQGVFGIIVAMKNF